MTESELRQQWFSGEITKYQLFDKHFDILTIDFLRQIGLCPDGNLEAPLDERFNKIEMTKEIESVLQSI